MMIGYHQYVVFDVSDFITYIVIVLFCDEDKLSFPVESYFVTNSIFC